MSRRVVILHGKDDVNVVRAAVRKFESVGVLCWSPYLDLGFSRDPHADTRDQIDASQGLVLIVDRDGEASEDVLKLLAYSQSREKFCFLGAGDGTELGELADTLWDAICDVEAGQVETIARALPYQPPAVLTPQAALLMSPALQNTVAYPRGQMQLLANADDFRSLKSRAFSAIAFIAIACLPFFLSFLTDCQIWLSLFSRSTLGAEEATRYVAKAKGSDSIQLIGFCLVVVAAIPFLIWVYRSVRNLRAMNVPGIPFSNGFAVAGFLIPFLNLVMPIQVMSTVARASMPWKREGDPTSWTENRTPNLLILWTLALYVPRIFVPLLVREVIPLSVNPVEEGMYLCLLDSLSMGGLVIAGVALCIAILNISQDQDDHYEGLSAAAQISSRTTNLAGNPGWA